VSVLVVANHRTATNAAIVAAFERFGLDAALVHPNEAVARARAGDDVLARLDIQPTLDGVEAGLWDLYRLKRRGVRLLNKPGSLLAAHDKLATAFRLSGAGLPHPRTSHLDGTGPLPSLRFPLVVKPRFGSWGRDVFLCPDAEALGDRLAALRRRRWFVRQGVLLQELVSPRGYDLRLVVAADEVVGAIERVAAPGEWRTNVSLGGRRRLVEPSQEACALATAAARAIGADLVGVDLLPDEAGGWTVLELNGAVDFTDDYSLSGSDVFAAVANALAPAQAIAATGALALGAPAVVAPALAAPAAL
jgi:RimK family alpha-L-glutamate ligase